ncbi:MAG: hypothetical protein ACHQQQ_08280 [Bacteroidota bacterium]
MELQSPNIPLIPSNKENEWNDISKSRAIPESVGAYFKQPFIIFNLAWLLYLAYLTYFVATDYQTMIGRQHNPFFIMAMDMVDLFIHEAGHFFFSFFGQVIYFMGGSLFQIILPIITLVVFARSGIRSMSFTLFWIGESMVNVSIYIADAQWKRLPLISRHATHDWNWLCVHLNLLDDAETIASVVNIIGIITCAGAIGVGIYCIISEVQEVRTSRKILLGKVVQKKS